MTTRFISALVIAGFFILSIFIVRPLFYGTIYIIAFLMLLEWYNMTKTVLIHNLIGLVVIPVAISSILIISYLDSTGWLLMTYFALIWSVDVMAMLGGKLIGGIKLAPQISPQKTLSGLAAGITGAVITSNLLALIPSYKLPYIMDKLTEHLNFYVIIFAFCAQMSDLFVSYFKRKHKIKDTGTIIPGHGGVLDRFDSIILTAPMLATYLLFTNIIDKSI